MAGDDSGGLDLLLEVVLREISLCGSEGATSEDLRRSVKKYYQTCHNFEYDDACTPWDDRGLLETVWDWLTRRPLDIQIVHNDKPVRLSLSEFEALQLPEEPSPGEENVAAITSTPQPSFVDDSLDSANATASAAVSEPTVPLFQSLREALSNTPTPVIQAPSNHVSNGPYRLPTSRTTLKSSVKAKAPTGKPRGKNIVRPKVTFPKPAVSTQSPRLFASQERAWQAITGHAIDHSKVPPLEFALLSIIASRGADGILQPELRKLSGQDKRSVPKRTDDLARKGYIIKRPVTTTGQRTSICVHKSFASDCRFSVVAKAKQGPPRVMVGDALVLPNLIHFLATSLKNTRIVTGSDLQHQLGLSDEKWSSRSVRNALRRLEKTGFIRRVKALQRGTINTWLFCIKLLREPKAEDFEVLTSKTRVNLKHTDEDNEDLEHNLEQDFELEVDALADGQGSSSNGSALSRRIVPQWTPSRPLLNLLANAIDKAGPRGTNSRTLKALTTGVFYNRPLELLLTRLANHWQKSQPAHLRHMGIVRDSTVTQEIKMAHFVFRTHHNFQKAVDAGEAFWEAVIGDGEKDPKIKTGKRSSTPTTVELDAFGFPEKPSTSFLMPRGSTWTLIARVAAVLGRGVKTNRNRNLGMPPRRATPKGTPKSLLATPSSSTYIRPPRRSVPEVHTLSAEKRIALGLNPRGRLKEDVKNYIYTQLESGMDFDELARIMKSAAGKAATSGSPTPLRVVMNATEIDSAATPATPTPGLEASDVPIGDAEMVGAEASGPQDATTIIPARRKATDELDAAPEKRTKMQNSVEPLPPSLLKSSKKVVPRQTRDRSVEPISADKFKKRKEKEEVRLTHANFENRVAPGIYVNPYMTRKIGRGRPKKAFMAVFKSDRLQEMPWFEAAPRLESAPPASLSSQEIPDPVVTTDSQEHVDDVEPVRRMAVTRRSEQKVLPKRQPQSKESAPEPVAECSNARDEQQKQPSQSPVEASVETPNDSSNQQLPQPTESAIDTLMENVDGTHAMLATSTSTEPPRELIHTASQPTLLLAETSTDIMMQNAENPQAEAPTQTQTIPTVFEQDENTPELDSETPHETTSLLPLESSSSKAAEASPDLSQSEIPTSNAYVRPAHSRLHPPLPSPYASPYPVSTNLQKPALPSVPITQFDVQSTPVPRLIPISAAERVEETSKPSKTGTLIGKGFANHFRINLLLEVLRRCNGVISGEHEAWTVFSSLWNQKAPANLLKPNRTTITTTVKNMVTSGRVSRLRFSFKTSRGQTIPWELLALPEIDPRSQLVLDIQQNISQAWPDRYYPPEVQEFVKKKAYSQKYRAFPRERQLDVEPKGPLEQRVHYTASEATMLRVIECRERRLFEEEMASHRLEEDDLSESDGEFDVEDQWPNKLRFIPDPWQSMLTNGQTVWEETSTDTETDTDSPALPGGRSHVRSKRRLPSRIYPDGKFMHQSPASFDNGHEYVEAIRLCFTDPPVRFHPTSGTFSTEFKLVRHARSELWVDPCRFIPLTLEEVSQQRLYKVPSGSMRHWSEVPESREFCVEINKIVAWEKQFANWSNEFILRWQPKDPFIHVTFPGKQECAVSEYPAGITWNFYHVSISTASNQRGIWRLDPPHSGNITGGVPRRRKTQQRRRPATRAPVLLKPLLPNGPLPPTVANGNVPRFAIAGMSAAEQIDQLRETRPKTTRQQKPMGRRRANHTFKERLTGIDTQAATNGAEEPVPPSSLEEESFESILSEKFKHLFYVLVIAKCMSDGSEEEANGHSAWDIVKLAYQNDATFDLEKAGKIWNFMQTNMSIKIEELSSLFGEKYFEAYEKEEVPPLEDIETHDWNQLVHWALKNCPVTRIELPANAPELGDWTIIESSYQNFSRDEWYKPGIPTYLKEQRSLNYRYAASIHDVPRETHDNSEQVLARSWIRSLVATPLNIFNGEMAHQKLSLLPDPLINSTISELKQKQILRMEKAKRLLPGRNLHFSASSARPFKRTLDVGQFGDAVKFKQEIDQTFLAEDPSHRRVRIPPHILSGAILVLDNLMAHGRVKLESSVPPPNNAGYASAKNISVRGLRSEDYRTRYIDRTLLDYPLIVTPTKKYVFGNPLAKELGLSPWAWKPEELPLPPTPGSNDPMAELPIWCQLDGETINWPWWHRVLNVLLQSIAFSTGTDTDDLHHFANGAIERFEIEMAVQWLIDVGAVQRTAGGGLIVREFWWCVFGEFNVEATDPVGAALAKKKMPDGLGWRKKRQAEDEAERRDGVKRRRPPGRPRKDEGAGVGEEGQDVVSSG